jgi:hypothetical protein
MKPILNFLTMDFLASDSTRLISWGSLFIQSRTGFQKKLFVVLLDVWRPQTELTSAPCDSPKSTLLSLCHADLIGSVLQSERWLLRIAKVSPLEGSDPGNS